MFSFLYTCVYICVLFIDYNLFGNIQSIIECVNRIFFCVFISVSLSLLFLNGEQQFLHHVLFIYIVYLLFGCLVQKFYINIYLASSSHILCSKALLCYDASIINDCYFDKTKQKNIHSVKTISKCIHMLFECYSLWFCIRRENRKFDRIMYS